MKTAYGVLLAVALTAVPLAAQQDKAAKPNPYTKLMEKAVAHARAHHVTGKQYLSPYYRMVLKGAVDVEGIHAVGAYVHVWTPDDAASMHALIAKKVDGIITDDPELLLSVLADERAKAKGNAAQLKYLDNFESSAHRGGRSDRPENTLPSFENGLDSGIKVLETDAGVTKDGIAAIWHESYYRPSACRKADGSEYTDDNKVWIHDVTLAEAQKMFICDKLPFPEGNNKDYVDIAHKQKNDLSLSPVSVAFAKKEGLANAYTPISLQQLFRFMKYYQWYYEKGPGKKSPHAKERAATAARAMAAPEIKYDIHVPPPHAQASAQEFVTAFGNAIKGENFMKRAEIQSFYLPSLILVQEQLPAISTYYLTSSTRNLKAPIIVPELAVF